MSNTPDQGDTKIENFHKAQPRAFGVILQQLEDGRLAADATARLGELCAELAKQADALGGKVKGKLVLTLKLSAERGGVVDIDSDIAITKPKASRHRTVMWTNAKGALSADNPRQMDLGLREVPGGKSEATKEAPARAEEAGR